MYKKDCKKVLHRAGVLLSFLACKNITSNNFNRTIQAGKTLWAIVKSN